MQHADQDRPDDLPDRPLPRVGAGPFRKPHPQAVTEVLFEGGVVGFRGCHVGLEQHPSVDGQPASVEGLHLVRDCDVGVQIRVASPAVPVGKRGRNQAADVDLPDPLRPSPGEQGVLLNEGQRVRDRSLVGASITAATAGSATAHKVETDFTGENVRS